MADATDAGPETTSSGSPAGVIYGVLAVATVVAAEGTRRETYAALLGASALTMALYWLAHAYADHLGRRFGRPEEWSWREIVVSLADEAGILAGAVLPAATLALSWAAGATVSTGVTASLWCAGVELAVIEVVASLRRRLSLGDTVVETAIGVVMGIGILGIRLLLH